jgi:hypothetical protein
VKERFGTLSFGFHSELPAMHRAVMSAVASSSQKLSSTVCQNCGLPGLLHDSKQRIRTLCDNCATDNGYGPDAFNSAVVVLTRAEFVAAPLTRSTDPQEMKHLLRDRIEYLLGLQTVTPAEIAARAGISLAALVAVSSGERPPTAEEVLGLSWAFGVPYERVFPGFGIEGPLRAST